MEIDHTLPVLRVPKDEDTSWQSDDPESIEPTEEEIRLGNELGQKINIDDDEDNGL